MYRSIVLMHYSVKNVLHTRMKANVDLRKHLKHSAEKYNRLPLYLTFLLKDSECSC